MVLLGRILPLVLWLQKEVDTAAADTAAAAREVQVAVLVAPELGVRVTKRLVLVIMEVLLVAY
jgi:hypothetical protein